MSEFLTNLIIGIIGGIFSSIIVSRIFLIRQNYQEQIDVLRQSFYHLGGITAFLDVVEIILKNSYDTSIEIAHNPNYGDNHNLGDTTKTMNALRKEILLKNINGIRKNDQTVILKEKKLRELHKQTIKTVSAIESISISNYKFETIDSFKKEVDALALRFGQVLSSKAKDFFILVLKDRILILLALIFVVLCILAIVL